MKIIPLTKGKVTLVNDSDFKQLNRWSWYALVTKHNVYAARSVTAPVRRCILMHREILPGFPEVDHHDGNGLNNLRSNLRPASASQNRANSKKRKDGQVKFKGVSFEKGKWRADITTGKRHKFLGFFRDPISAAREYDLQAIRTFGKFACLNFSAIGLRNRTIKNVKQTKE